MWSTFVGICLSRHCSYKVPGQTRLVCYLSSSHRRHGLELCLRPESCFLSRLSNAILGFWPSQPTQEQVPPASPEIRQSSTLCRVADGRCPVRGPRRCAPAPELTRPWRSKQAITTPPQSSMQPMPLRTPTRAVEGGVHRIDDPCGKWEPPDGASSWLACKTSPVFQRPPTSSLAIIFNPTQGAGSCVRVRPGVACSWSACRRWREHMRIAMIPNIPPVSPGDVICILSLEPPADLCPSSVACPLSLPAYS